MSNAMQNMCRPLQLMPSEKAVLMCLADCASDNGHCFILVSTLELYTCLGERTVRRAVGSLVASGYVRLESRHGRSNVYWLIPEAIDAGILPEHRRNLTPATTAPPPAKLAPTPANVAPTPANLAPITVSLPGLNHHNPQTVREANFELVWQAYPRKSCKAEARKEWMKLGGDEALTGRMLQWIAVQQQTDQWQRGIVPHLRTVLHQRRFEDPLPGDAGAATKGQACIKCGEPGTVIFEGNRYCRRDNPLRAEHAQ